MLRIIFAGTPDFAVPTLQALLDSDHEVVAVYTQPDRPAGRGRQLQASPVKQLAQQAGVGVYQPKTLKAEGAQADLRSHNADVMIVVAYGLLLPAAVLEIPQYGCINVHASLLPRWRGAAPIQHAILAGDDETGVAIMQMDVGLDTGPVYEMRSCPITNTDTGQTIHDRLSAMGADTLLNVLDKLQSGAAVSTAQPNNGVTYASKLTKEMARIDWSKPAQQLDCLIRAFNPWPVAYTDLGDSATRVRVWKAELITEQADNLESGKIFSVNDTGVDVVTENGGIRLLELQLAGGKRLPVAELLKSKRDLFAVGNKFT